ncbi:MAG TPA: hypothetical protein VFT06_13605, partial [Flavisolibacter sp.]|nr:hypothetical protein [Flavisolibacter sp.]
MDNKTGKTFWDLVHESIVVKITLIGIVLVILAATIFFIANGYSVTTSGIIAPHETTDTTKSTQVAQNPNNANSNLTLHQLNGISRLVWVIVFLQIILVLVGVLIFSTQIINRRKGKYVGNAEKKTETIEFIYKSFIALTLFDREQTNELLANIQLLSRYTV